MPSNSHKSFHLEKISLRLRTVLNKIRNPELCILPLSKKCSSFKIGVSKYLRTMGQNPALGCAGLN